jgi:hypothetical protein
MIGMFTDEAYQDLVTLKDIRNAFAHRLDVKDFQTPTIRDWCQNDLKLIETHVGNYTPSATEKTPVVSFGFADRPRIYVKNIEPRKKLPRDRYLITAQLFSVCLAPAELPDHPFPLV